MEFRANRGPAQTRTAQGKAFLGFRAGLVKWVMSPARQQTSTAPAWPFLPWPPSRGRRRGSQAEGSRGLPWRGPSLYSQSGRCRLALSLFCSQHGQGLAYPQSTIHSAAVRAIFHLDMITPHALLHKPMLAVTVDSSSLDRGLPFTVETQPFSLLHLLPQIQVKSLPPSSPHGKDTSGSSSS